MVSKKKAILLKIANVLGFVLVIVMNTLANVLPINGRATGEISDMYPNLFVPAGITFSIWGVIYLFLLLFVIYQSGILNRHSLGEIEKLQQITGLFVLSSMANASWILCWHYGLISLSVVVMIILFITLLMLYQRTRLENDAPLKQKLFLSIPFSLYLGWITVATIANITALLVSFKWDGWGIPQEIWTAAVILVAIGITVLMQKTFKDIAYSLVVLWALLGILIRHVNSYQSQYPLVIGIVALGLGVVLSGILFIIITRNKGNISLN